MGRIRRMPPVWLTNLLHNSESSQADFEDWLSHEASTFCFLGVQRMHRWICVVFFLFTPLYTLLTSALLCFRCWGFPPEPNNEVICLGDFVLGSPFICSHHRIGSILLVILVEVHSFLSQSSFPWPLHLQLPSWVQSPSGNSPSPTLSVVVFVLWLYWSLVAWSCIYWHSTTSFLHSFLTYSTC